MHTITSVDALEDLYDATAPISISKVAAHITPLYRKWIEVSRFVVVSTVGPEGVDASPRGDDGPVVTLQDPHTILLPDWRGNNRLDTLRNIVRDPRISLMFMVPGSNNVVRVIGDAVVSVDPSLTQRFEKQGATPRTVAVITVTEVYFQCAKAIMRARLWSGFDESGFIPSAGDFIKENQGTFDGKAYDEGYSEYAKTRLW